MKIDNINVDLSEKYARRLEHSRNKLNVSSMMLSYIKITYFEVVTLMIFLVISHVD